jgi:hypothetical protein
MSRETKEENQMRDQIHYRMKQNEELGHVYGATLLILRSFPTEDLSVPQWEEKKTVREAIVQSSSA